MFMHTFETKVYYFDTDSYNIVWHGTYIKWFEIGRVEFFNLLGEDLDKLTSENILFPVVNLSVRYKAPARFGDTIVVTTTLDHITTFSIKFKHEVFNKLNNKLLVTGNTEVVITNSEGKLLRHMPDSLFDKFSKLKLQLKQ